MSNRTSETAEIAEIAETAKTAEIAENGAAAQDRPELRELAEEIVASGFTGVHLRVHDERGDRTGTAGVAELDDAAGPPVDGHVRIGSNTKTFTATVVLQLVAEGRIALDAPAADYLPELGLDRRIIVRMLLQHTSGIFNHTGELLPDGTFAPGVPWSGRAWVEDRFKSYRPEELARLALSKPARFEPGTDWSYANTNYVLARMIVEAVTGHSLAEEMQRLILGPLGLTGTRVPDAGHPQLDVPEPHAHAYYRYEDADGEQRTVDVTRQNPSWISSGGDMISTAQDLHTFISALVRGELLPPELLAEMFTPEAKAGYGLGVFVQDAGDGAKVITHNGGHGGHAALMFSTPDGSRTLTAALNYVDDAELSLGAAFQQVLGRLVETVFGGGRTGPAAAGDEDAEAGEGAGDEDAGQDHASA